MSILLTIHKIQLLSIFLCNTAMVKFTCTTRANKLEISRQTQKQRSHTGHVGDPEQTFTSDGFPGTQPACLKSVYIPNSQPGASPFSDLLSDRSMPF